MASATHAKTTATSNQALISHYFGSKQRLFIEVVELPFLPSVALPPLFEGDPSDTGKRLADFLVGVLDTPEGRERIAGLVRAAATEPEAARMVRDLLMRELWKPVTDLLGVDDAQLRVTLVASQMIGLVMGRYVIEAEPLASMPVGALVAAIAPTLQRYLRGPIDVMSGSE